MYVSTSRDMRSACHCMGYFHGHLADSKASFEIRRELICNSLWPRIHAYKSSNTLNLSRRRLHSSITSLELQYYLVRHMGFLSKPSATCIQSRQFDACRFDVNLDPTATAKSKGQAAVSPHLSTRHVVAGHSGLGEVFRHVSRLEIYLFPDV